MPEPSEQPNNTGPQLNRQQTEDLVEASPDVVALQAQVAALEVDVAALQAQFPVDLATNAMGVLHVASTPVSVTRALSGSITHASVGSGTTTVNVALPANSILHGVRVKTTIVFSGNAISSAVLKVGVSGLLDLAVADYNLLDPVAVDNLQVNGGASAGNWFAVQPTTAAYNVVFTFTCDADPTAGAVLYNIFYTPLS